MWPQTRARLLGEQTVALFAGPVVRFTLMPSGETAAIRYFPADLSLDMRAVASPFQYVTPDAVDSSTGIILLIAHGSDLSQMIWELRGRAPNAIIGVWLWDNHQAREANHRTVLAADFVFPSHDYASGYLPTPAAVMAAHVPLCCGLWSRAESVAYFQQMQSTHRSGQLLVNYVDYKFSWRTELLARLKAEMAGADVLLMRPQDRSRFFGLSKADRFAEWMRYKTTLILPVTQDLSTRVFDALVAGQVLLVPAMITDFDRVIPPDAQRALGIVKLPDCEVATIRSAHAAALKTFDDAGDAGVRARHEYAVNHHMLLHRTVGMLEVLHQVGTRRLQPAWITAPLTPGLYLAHSPPHAPNGAV